MSAAGISALNDSGVAAALRNPFPGLRPFDVGEEDRFFGREGQSQEILRRLREKHFVAVVGASGSGKSSLVRAGLLPYLYGGFMAGGTSHWRVAVFRPGSDPIGNFAAALNSADVLGSPEETEQEQQKNELLLEVGLRRGGLGLIEAVRLRRLPEHESTLIVVDQFEELFRFAGAAGEARKAGDAAAFVRLLLEAAQPRTLPIFVVLTMRSDFIGDCARFRDLPEAVAAGLYLVPKMTRDQRRSAIEEPVRVSGSQISRRLVNRLLNDGGDDPDQLPILQHALMRTWDHWKNQPDRDGRPIDLEDYIAIGQLVDALSQHAEEAYSELPDERHREIARHLFQCLTEKGPDNRELRHPLTIANVAAVAEAEISEVIAVINCFRCAGRSFLTPSCEVPLHNDSVIDISHESLIRGWKRLNDWVEEESRFAQEYRRLAETAERHATGSADLLHEPDLGVALKWVRDKKPNAAWAARYRQGFEQSLAYLEASRERREREKAEIVRQREKATRRKIATTLALITCIAAGIVIFLQVRNSFLLQRADQKQAEANAKFQAQRREQAETDAKQEENWLRQSLETSESMKLSADLQTVNLANELRPLMPAKRAAELRQTTYLALTQMGDHLAALTEAEAALKSDPDDSQSRFYHGIESLYLGRTQDAVNDFQQYLKSNPQSSLAHSDLAAPLATLRRYDQAIAETRKAIAAFQYDTYGDIFQSEVWPEIQLATGQSVIHTSDIAYYVARNYELVNIIAMKNGSGMDQALQTANRIALQNGFLNAGSNGPQLGSIDPLLIAINEGWLSYRFQESVSQDYGILASFGALWQIAAQSQPRFQDWAAHAYDQFQQLHQRRQDHRYDGLSAWVTLHQKQLHPPGSTRFLSPGESQATVPVTLQVQNLLLPNEKGVPDRKNIATAERILSDEIRRIEKDPASRAQLVELLLSRAGTRWQKRDTSGKLPAKDIAAISADCSRVLKFAPNTPSAYLILAYSDTDSAAMRHHLEQVLKYDPQNKWANVSLGSLEPDPKRALTLIERSNHVAPQYPDGYYYQAQKQRALNRFDQALQSINTAIALRSSALAYYEERSLDEEGLHRSDTEVTLSKASGYREAGYDLAKVGNADEAVAWYSIALRALIPLYKEPVDPQVQAELLVDIRTISRLVESTRSRQVATRFWTIKLNNPSYKPFASAINQEIQFLAR